MDVEIRVPTEEEYETWIRVFRRASGHHAVELDASLRSLWIEPDRLLAAYDDGDMEGTTVASSVEMSIPGGSLPTARIDDVGVSPTRRRKGILTRLMKRQLSDIHERGEPLAMLEASESVIYGRFGFGIGVLAEDWSIDRQHTAFVSQIDRPGRLRLVDPEEAKGVYRLVNDGLAAQRSGVVRYHQSFWDYFLADPEFLRRGASALFHVVYEDGGVEGCASYRVNGETLGVQYLAALTNDAYAALWRFLLDVDLMASFQAYGRAVDEALPWMLADPRRLRRSMRDESWLRIVDVRAALSARRYARSGRLNIEVRDPICPWNDGVVELDGGPDAASCRPTSESSDLVLSASDLAAAYLGTVRLATLLAAGRVEERVEGAVRTADAMFATRLQPWAYR